MRLISLIHLLPMGSSPTNGSFDDDQAIVNFSAFGASNKDWIQSMLGAHESAADVAKIFEKITNKKNTSLPTTMIPSGLPGPLS